MEGILSQEEINQLLRGDFFEEELDEKTVTNSVAEQSAKPKSRFGVNSSGKEITALNPKGIHKQSVAPDGTIREVNTDVKFTNRIMDNVIAGKNVEYPKTFASGIMDQNPGMFETIESENKGKVLLRPTDEFFSTTNIDRTGEYAKPIMVNGKPMPKELTPPTGGSNGTGSRAPVENPYEKLKGNEGKQLTATETKAGELLKENGLFDEEAERRVKNAQNKVEADSKFEEAKIKKQEELKSEEIKKKEVINTKVAENKKLIAANEKEMDSAVDDITKMYSSGTEKINVENINAGKSINNGNPGTGATGTGSAGAAGAEATEEVKPRQFSSPMEKIIAETEYGPAGKTMETSGVFTEDAGKYNLKNIAEMEAKVAIEAEKANKLQLDSIPDSEAVKKGIFGGIFSGGKNVELIDHEFKFESEVFKGGEFAGNYGKFGTDAAVETTSQLENVRASLNSAKNKLLKESYEPASHGSDVHFERGIISKLDDVQLTKGLQTENASDYLKQLDIDDDTKVSWSKTEDGGLEGIYKKAKEVDGINVGESKTAYDSHKIRVNFGKDGAISGFENQKLDAKTGEWAKNEAKIDLGNGQQVGIERAKEIAKMNEKQVRMDMINQNRQAVKDGVEGAKSMGLMEELKLKLGKGAKAEEAKTMMENAKAAVKSHTEATETMAKNIGGILGDAGRVDLKAISAAASGAVEGAAKEAGKNTHAMGNNTGKGMTNLLILAGVGMAFGAVKATFDNSAEQRRQKQLELMSMRQQYGGAM